MSVNHFFRGTITGTYWLDLVKWVCRELGRIWLRGLLSVWMWWRVACGMRLRCVAIPLDPRRMHMKRTNVSITVRFIIARAIRNDTAPPGGTASGLHVCVVIRHCIPFYKSLLCLVWPPFAATTARRHIQMRPLALDPVRRAVAL